MPRHYRPLDGLVISICLWFSCFAIPVLAAGTLQGRLAEWPRVGGDAGAMRFSPLTQINTRSVKRLGATWISKRFDEGAATRATPIVSDGLMFVTAGLRVYALDPRTGATVWVYRTGAGAAVNPLNLGGYASSAAPLTNNQGVAVGGGLVFIGLSDGSLIALDEQVGKLVWTKTLRVVPGPIMQGVTAAPIYHDGYLYTSLTTIEQGRGVAIALDAHTGREVWRFYTIPAPNEPGHETWPQDSDSWKSGSGNIWLPPVIDPALGLVYYATGNADPARNGDLRWGDNLYTDSVLALDLKSGELRWYYQLLRHDVWDGDIAIPLVLFDYSNGGQRHPGLAAMRSDGVLFLLDRRTGKPLQPMEERPEPPSPWPHERTATSQPFPVGSWSILPDCASHAKSIPVGFVLSCNYYTPPSVESPNILSPGFSTRVDPLSFSPQTGYFYAQGEFNLFWRRRAEDPLYHDAAGYSERVPGITRSRAIVTSAIDSRTGRLVWTKPMPPSYDAINQNGGGFLSTAGGLVFHRAGDGRLQAFDARDGTLLWQFQTGHAGGTASPMSYAIAGQQYIAVSEGSEVWAFRIGGAVPVRPAPQPISQEDEFLGPISDTDRIEAVYLRAEDSFALGTRYLVDEYAVNPYRARVRAGTPVEFANNGHKVHTFVATDGSWSTGPLRPNEVTYLTFKNPGRTAFFCKEHPWTYGQLIVVAGGVGQSRGDGTATRSAIGMPFVDSGADQMRRGKELYQHACASCHGPELGGNGQAAPAIAGNRFRERWRGESGNDLLERISHTMPQNSPGSLGATAYVDITAYLLAFNDLWHADRMLTVEQLQKLPLAPQ